jgi:hypothetical protein
MKPTLTEEDYIAAADKLGVEVAIIKAVAEVESKGKGFLDTGEPVILFERHKFHTFTGGLFDKSHPNISNKKPGGYGKVSDQHKRLQEAASLDRDAALRSASWGKFQIMGFNWAALGYESVQDFVNAMYISEAEHLDAFLRFITVNNLLQYLKDKNWAKFARGYNGKDYKINDYDGKLARAYKKFKSG